MKVSLLFSLLFALDCIARTTGQDTYKERAERLPHAMEEKEEKDESPDYIDDDFVDDDFGFTTSVLNNTCEDDPTWKWEKYFNKPQQKGCAWVAKKKNGRCKDKNKDVFGRKASNSCPKACDTCDTYEPTSLEYVGEDHVVGALGICQGDCDDDSDCALGLICFERENDEAVPFCPGTGPPGKDYCTIPPPDWPDTLVTRGRGGIPTEAFPLDKCEGHCESDEDCKEGLRCQTRDGWDLIFGCNYWGAYDESFCVIDNGWLCQNDPTWAIKNKAQKNCDWVSINPSKRCSKKGLDKRIAFDACPLACNKHDCADNESTGIPLKYVGDDLDELKECEGDCNVDADCVGDLICYQRNEGERVVPRCIGNADSFGQGSENYCIRPPSLNEPRIIAIGDVHGDINATKNALQLAGIIDDNDSWIGGETQVVQLGDQTDRGDTEREILDLFVKLEEEATSAGGSFHALNGNHEVLNVELDFTYVTDGGWAEFSDVPYSPNDEQLMSYPEYQRGRVAAFRPGGLYAKILATRPIIFILNKNLFVHGGVLPGHLEYGIETINTEISEWMEGIGQEPNTEYIRDEDHPIWSRHYSDGPNDNDCAMLEHVLEETETDRMIVSHTIQWDEGINSDCNGKVWRVDVGLSEYYAYLPAQILEIIGDYISVIQ